MRHRRHGALVLLAPAVAALGLAGCSSRAPATGVTRVDRAVVVAYKPCQDDAGLGIRRLALYGSDDVDHPVWEARYVDRTQPAVLDLPVVERYPGYRITDRRPGGALDEDQRYSFEATATDGTEWGGPGFKVQDLRQGRVQVAGQELEFATWVDSPTPCPKVTFVDALLTGLVVAAVAGSALLLVRRLTRRGRRAP
ncbi:hypothetical protein KSP35_00920 [Aquihabitans sp. G128]|uniref:hypothetical protein n=1 Tax=Aquihabitans sp. G128 TaxID=2849779 RepID=UPI001C211502|nr:hypothetical protein [Aquihabitans sp. G128]QXC61445.1 hypothetical protein KSP35_00920 [Aquihabitans sp. G128]